MVKQTFRKIQFIPYVPGKKGREKDTEEVTCSVNTKFKMISFGRKCIAKLGMNGKLIRLFYEPSTKKIGWRMYNESIEHAKMTGIKLVKPNPTTGIYKVVITKMLDDMAGLKESYKDLVVKKWVDDDMLNKGDIYYYIQLKDNKDEDDEV